VAEQLPITAWKHYSAESFVGDYAKTMNSSQDWTTYYCVALTPRAPAQSALDELRREVEALRVDRDRLRDVATGKIKHVFNGLCPDDIEGPNVRDPDCMACQILDAAIDTARASTDEGVGK